MAKKRRAKSGSAMSPSNAAVVLKSARLRAIDAEDMIARLNVGKDARHLLAPALERRLVAGEVRAFP